MAARRDAVELTALMPCFNRNGTLEACTRKVQEAVHCVSARNFEPA